MNGFEEGREGEGGSNCSEILVKSVTDAGHSPGHTVCLVVLGDSVPLLLSHENKARSL